MSVIRHHLGVLGTKHASLLVLLMDKRDLSPVRPLKPQPSAVKSEPDSQSSDASSQEQETQEFPEELDQCNCNDSNTDPCLWCISNLTDGVSVSSEVDDVIDPSEEGIATFRIGKHFWIPFVGRDVRGKHDVTY